MASNHLEQLVAEWYQYKGYFVRQNVLVGKRAKGGYECELDIVAFHPETNHLAHVEPSMDADSWSVREQRYANKFEAGRKHIPKIFRGFNIPTKIEQIALLVFASKQNHKTLAQGKIILLGEMLVEILKELRTTSIESNAVPEQYLLLRTLQFVAQYKKDVIEALSKDMTGQFLLTKSEN